MLNPRTSSCVDCTTISALLSNIDCKLKELGSDLYNNTVYILNRPVQSEVYLSLLNYKRILTYKAVNEDYAQGYTVADVANRVKILIHK